MSWWRWLRQTPSNPSLPERLGAVTLTMDGWTETSPANQMRVWLNSQGDVLSLATMDGTQLPSLTDINELQRYCRAMAQSLEAGLIEMRLYPWRVGTAIGFIYKRRTRETTAYTFGGMLLVPGDEFVEVWTIVSRERGTTGVREAIVTAQLTPDGKMTIEDYQRWAQDPYDAAYSEVDRSVLRFVSDDERYDGQFPDHPLSKVRRVLAALPTAVRIEPGGPGS